MRPAALSISASGTYTRPMVVCLKAIISCHKLPDPGLDSLKQIADECPEMERLKAVLWQFNANFLITEPPEDLIQWMSTPPGVEDPIVRGACGSWYAISGKKETAESFISEYIKCRETAIQRIEATHKLKTEVQPYLTPQGTEANLTQRVENLHLSDGAVTLTPLEKYREYLACEEVDSDKRLAEIKRQGGSLRDW
ncbi:hypothetical protein A7D00_3083 [Trichophyton violaceum]|uniref:Uncharacterized protein n=1 Tax=Trichophyton violaceum TaxID=34388 RepID=A0A178FJJ4_TRIVO|nr:hypothetical protein A7D00_3083 [Trichophyton violaceum]